MQIASCYQKRIESRRTENGNNSSRSQLLMMTIWRPHQTAFKSLVSGKGDWGMGRGSCLGRHFTLYTWRHLRTEIKKDVWNWSFACHHHSMWLGRCTENVLAGWWGGRCTEMCRPRDEGIAVLRTCRPRDKGVAVLIMCRPRNEGVSNTSIYHGQHNDSHPQCNIF